MFIFIGIVLLILSIMLHEAGHAIAMARRGVEIEEAGIGMSFSKKIRFTFHPRFLPFPLVLTPFLIGAYVKPTPKGEEQIKALSYRDQSVIYGAGVIMNALFGSVLFAAAWALSTAMRPDNKIDWTPLFIYVGVGVLAAIFRRWISPIMPLFGIGALVLIVISIISSLNNIGGPIEAIRYVTSGTGWAETIFLAGNISFSLAILNLIPLRQLDGGQITSALLVRWKLTRTESAFTLTTSLILLGFIVFIIGKDVVNLF